MSLVGIIVDDADEAYVGDLVTPDAEGDRDE